MCTDTRAHALSLGGSAVLIKIGRSYRSACPPRRPAGWLAGWLAHPSPCSAALALPADSAATGCTTTAKKLPGGTSGLKRLARSRQRDSWAIWLKIKVKASRPVWAALQVARPAPVDCALSVNGDSSGSLAYSDKRRYLLGQALTPAGSGSRLCFRLRNRVKFVGAARGFTCQLPAGQLLLAPAPASEQARGHIRTDERRADCAKEVFAPTGWRKTLSPFRGLRTTICRICRALVRALADEESQTISF